MPTTTPTFWSDAFAVNTHTTFVQRSPVVTQLANGNFVVAWSDDDVSEDPSGGTCIKLRIFDAAGNPLTSEISRPLSGDDSFPDIVATSDGGFLLSFTNTSSSGSTSIQVFRYSSDGSALSAQVIDNASGESQIVQLSNGAVVVAYNDLTAGVLTAYQSAPGQPFTFLNVSPEATSNNNEPTIAALAGGGYAVAWDNDGGSNSIEMRIYNALGTSLTSVITVHVGTSTVTEPSIIGLANGNILVTYTTFSPEDSSGSGVQGRIFTAAGVPIGAPFLVNTTLRNSQSASEIVALADGGFFVLWVDISDIPFAGSDIRGQRFGADGVRIGNEIVVNQTALNNQADIDATLMADGRILVTWADESGAFDPDSGITARIIDPRDASISGSNNDDRIYARRGDSIIDGLDGNDTLIGMEGDDILRGGAGADNLQGGDGDDRIEGGSGADTINGGQGANFVDAGSGNDSVATGGGGDEIRLGSGNDFAVGGNGNDVIYGDLGNDFLNGGAGADTMVGGADNDVYTIENLGDVVIEAASGGNDTVRVEGFNYTLLEHFENLTILSGNTNGTGNTANNFVTGSAGNNTLAGLAGDDTLRGFEGNDILQGGNGNDILNGGLGRDTMTGGEGLDRFVFAAINESTPGPVFADRITDFSQADGDKIALDVIDAIAGGANDAFTFIGTAAFTAAGQVRFFFNGVDTEVQLDVNGGGVDMTIVLSGNVNLVASDFVL